MIGTNTETHAAERAAWDRGYSEALLDVYCFLTANEQVFDLDPAHLSQIEKMVEQVNQKSSKLQAISE
jgi:hypothetical protein